MSGELSYSDKRIDILLAEYEARYNTWNQYDSVRWIIGSILIITSFT